MRYQLFALPLGVVFVAHGAQKALGSFGGPGLEGFVQWAGNIANSICACLCLLRLLSLSVAFALRRHWCRIGALLILPVMLGAIWFVHLDNGFFIQNGGFEYPLTLLINCIVIFLSSI